MELNQGEIIQNVKMQEFSSLFRTYHLNVMHAPVKFHEYIPYGLATKWDIQTDRRTYGTDRGNTLCPSAILRIGWGIKMKHYVKLFINEKLK